MLNKVTCWQHISKRKTWIYLVFFVYLALVAALAIACKGNAASTTTPTSPNSEVLTLVAMAEKARPQAAEMISEAVLRQVDYLPTGRYTFRFTDPAATQGSTVFASSTKPPEQWQTVTEVSQLLGRPSLGVDLQALVIGPRSAMDLAEKHWQRGGLRGLTLTGEG